LTSSLGVSDCCGVFGVDDLLVGADWSSEGRLLLLLADRDLEVHVKLLLGLGKDYAIFREDQFQDVVSTLLAFERLSVFLHSIVCHGDCLVTASDLHMLIAEHVSSLLEMHRVSIKSWLVSLNLLVHQTKVEIDIGNLGVMVTSADLQNAQ